MTSSTLRDLIEIFLIFTYFIAMYWIWRPKFRKWEWDQWRSIPFTIVVGAIVALPIILIGMLVGMSFFGWH